MSPFQIPTAWLAVRQRSIRLISAILVAGLIGPGVSAAEAATPINEHQEIIKLDTGYHAPSDTHFQLVQDWKTSQGVNWSEARDRASRLTYRGRVGRLAVIRSADLFTWVLNALPLSEIKWGQGATWIGLRYWCGANQLMWVDMQSPGRDPFYPWAVPWSRNGEQSCIRGRVSYMGVYQLGQVGRWQAAGPAKRFPHYLVEYPPANSNLDDDQSATTGSEPR